MMSLNEFDAHSGTLRALYRKKTYEKCIPSCFLCTVKGLTHLQKKQTARLVSPGPP